VFGSAVEGGVVAYQVGFVFFLAPYGVLAQPIHTAILPDLVAEATEGGAAVFAASTRWALERMAVLVVPVSAGMVALAYPAMRIVSTGATEGEGVRLLAAAVASLAVGLLPYSAFLLLARGYYALGDSRTPGVMAMVAAATGAVFMGAGVLVADGAARVAVLGLGHSLAYSVGAVVLGARLARRLGSRLFPAALARVVGISAVVGVAGWAAQRALLSEDASRLAELVVVGGVGIAGAGLVVAGYRLLGVTGSLTARLPAPGASPQVPELEAL
jgi:putative peptidoglycan lipid II flippase